MNFNATILGQAIAFVLFVIFCMRYVWPPLIATIEKRQKEIADSLAAARRAKKDLDIARIEASNYLSQAKIKAQSIIEQANKHKVQLIDEAKIQAETERNKILKQARLEIKVASKRASEELRKQISIFALSCAEKIIEHSVDEISNSALIDKIIAQITERNKADA